MMLAGRRVMIESLQRVGLLSRVFRLLEVIKGLSLGECLNPGPREGPDGLPLPPARLRVRVAGTSDIGWFMESGRREADVIVRALEGVGAGMEDFDTILDFGCGCGRVTRHWAQLRGPTIHGTDYNWELVRWCLENLEFGRFTVNGARPPLSYPDGAFDFVYAVSVFTHLSERLQLAWVKELRRLLRPGGYLLVTVQGDRYLDRLTESEKARFVAGELVVRREQAAGSNLCSTYHPPAYLRDVFAKDLNLMGFVPGISARLRQDAHLLQKPGY